MNVTSSLAALSFSGAGICIGNFDGVHLGHRALLQRLRALADSEQIPAIIVTFFPPARVLFSGATYLSSAEEKLELLGEYRPDAVALLPFDREFAQTEASEFVAQLRDLSPHTLIVGEDFRFGKNRAGGLDELRAASARLEPFGMVTLGGEVVKSSAIRDHLAAGRVERANELLGRPYPASGVVARGAQRGRTIGYPTANLQVDPRKTLPQGVFAVTVDTHAGTFAGMANSGPRPSFPDAPPALEVHLFGFSGDLYDQPIRVNFHKFLRSQRLFGGLAELEAQLGADVIAARAALSDLGRW